jgi:hypothetical protein
MTRSDTENPNTRGLNTSAFNSEDLKFFEQIVAELLKQLGDGGDYSMQCELRRDLARAVFANANPGDRDAAALIRRVVLPLPDPRKGTAPAA